MASSVKLTNRSLHGELVTLIYKARKGMSQGSNVTVRGVGPMSFKLRSGFQTVAGRLFQPGLTEAVVSKRIAERFQGLDIGDRFRIQTTDYTVVGLFDSAGKAFESEIWVDINSLAEYYQARWLLVGADASEGSECIGSTQQAHHRRSKAAFERNVRANFLRGPARQWRRAR
jgi:hypothetical protein